MSVQIYAHRYTVTDVYLYKVMFSLEKESSCDVLGTQELERQWHRETIVGLTCLYELFLLSNCKRLKKKSSQQFLTAWHWLTPFSI